MPLKDILVCLDPTEAGKQRLHLAAALANEHAAHLSAAYVQLDGGSGEPGRDTVGLPAPDATGSGRTLVWGLPFPERADDAAPYPRMADILEERFRDIVEGNAVGDWHILEPGEGAELLALIRGVDLAVIGQVSPDYPAPSGFRPADLVMAAGRPLLVTPYAGVAPSVGRRVLIAWDGTREASRAVHDALPLIARADLAVVMTVRDEAADFESGDTGLDRIVRHLERHGIRTRAEESVRGDIPVSDVLLSRAADFDVDLIVTGAYHHSQLREALLGGVSRELLEHMTVPLLMSH